MKKIFIAVALFCSVTALAQADSSPKERVDSIRGMLFAIPVFFNYQKTDSTAFMEMRNNDTSVCQMRVFPSFRNKAGDSLAASTLWTRFAVPALTGADPSFRQQMGDTVTNGWRTRFYIGNYRQGGKRSIAFLFWFNKGEEQRVALCNFSDRIFRQPVEKFTNGLQPR